MSCQGWKSVQVSSDGVLVRQVLRGLQQSAGVLLRGAQAQGAVSEGAKAAVDVPRAEGVLVTHQ